LYRIIRSMMPNSSFSAMFCAMTGVPEMSRPGNMCLWAPLTPRTSRPLFRPGLSLLRLWNLSKLSLKFRILSHYLIWLKNNTPHLIFLFKSSFKLVKRKIWFLCPISSSYIGRLASSWLIILLLAAIWTSVIIYLFYKKNHYSCAI